MIIGSIGYDSAILTDHNNYFFNNLYEIAYEWLNSNPITELVTDLNAGWGLAVGKAAMDSHIKITNAIAYKNQELMFSPIERALYRELFTTGNSIFISDGGYEPKKKLIKNKWIIDNTDKMLVLYSGGKYDMLTEAIDYAKGKNKEIINLFNKLTL